MVRLDWEFSSTLCDWDEAPAPAQIGLPLAKLYKPMWEYDAKTLARDLGAHIVYGLGTAAAFRILARS